MTKQKTLSLTATAGAAFTAAAAGHIWSRYVEPQAFVLREFTIPLPAAKLAHPVRILHLSDIHLVPTQTLKLNFLRLLAEIDVDLVINTGDNLSHPDAVDPLAQALTGALAKPGAFVFGSNDMYAPKRKNIARYLLPDPRLKGYADQGEFTLPTADLEHALAAEGWLNLNNRRDQLELPEVVIDFVGTDDPHLDRDAFPAQSKPVSAEAATDKPRLKIGVTHAPYQRVLDEMCADEVDLILAGHTHGGQLRLPGFGALTSNCDLPISQARGLSKWQGTPLHVCAGAGGSPFNYMRFACRPEASLLTLVPGAQ